jgi:hypothetical protein
MKKLRTGLLKKDTVTSRVRPAFDCTHRTVTATVRRRIQLKLPHTTVFSSLFYACKAWTLHYTEIKIQMRWKKMSLSVSQKQSTHFNTT